MTLKGPRGCFRLLSEFEGGLALVAQGFLGINVEVLDDERTLTSARTKDLDDA